MDKQPIKAPFPYFGGKSRIADLVWKRIGDVPNVVDPFMGSCSFLLARPHPPQLETVNDADGLLSNFWRSIKHDPDAVAEHADYPVVESDLHARHAWLVGQRESLTARLEGDLEFYDARAAGWWVWGVCCWIGRGWCAGKGPWHVVDGRLVNTGKENGTSRPLPQLGDAGRGIHRNHPHLGNAGMGIHRNCPHLGGGRSDGLGVHNPNRNIYEWFRALSDRLRRVRVCSGDWTRVMGPSVTVKHGLTGVFLDPPYSAEAGRASDIYAKDCLSVAHDVREWCIENGDNPMLRIALCGYDDLKMPPTWEMVRWKAHGGYGLQSDGRGRNNRHREVIWFSPHCLKAQQGTLEFKTAKTS